MRIWGYSESEAGLTFANLRLEYESESGANFTSVEDIRDFGHHWCRQWLGTCQVPSHYPKQWWLHIVRWTLRNRFQRNLNQNTEISIQENIYIWKYCLQKLNLKKVSYSVFRFQYVNSSDAGDGIFRLWGWIPCLMMLWLLKSPEHQ